MQGKHVRLYAGCINEIGSGNRTEQAPVCHRTCTLAEAGAKVVLLGRRRQKLQETQQLIDQGGGEASCLPRDLFDKAAAAGIAGDARAVYGAVDIAAEPRSR